MSHFVIPECTESACINWRPGNRCAKDQVPIPHLYLWTPTMQKAEVCAVRRQMDEMKVRNLLEEK